VQVAVVVAWSLVETRSGESNPVGVLPPSWADDLDGAADWLLQAPLLLAAAAIVVRLRRPADRAGLRWLLGGALGFAVLAVLGHALLPTAADALDVLGALVLGAGLTAALLRRPELAPTPSGSTNDRDSYDDRLAALSAREREVLDLVAEGLTNRQIAERLVISPVTARNHVSRILTKLGLENRTQAAAWLARGVPDQHLP
jgi:DNA-binding CsgD family transcriptional regulator